MIIARAPLRLSLAGGGTDLPDYADRFGGIVVSTTIDRYVYATLTVTGDDTRRITAADNPSFFSHRAHLFDGALFWGDDHRLPRETLHHFGITGGYRLFLAAEVPPGTGLGSSSATAVALITALAAQRGESMGKGAVAELASRIEIERMGMPIGRQDQYASAHGGLNVIAFAQDGVAVTPCAMPPAAREALRRNLLIFFTGQRRRSTDILLAQREATARPSSNTLAALHEIKALAFAMIAALQTGDLAEVGALLDRSWQQKRRLASGISNEQIDDWYAAAKAAGALGGKIAGAGGGGFLLLYVDPERQAAVVRRMAELGLTWVDVDFEEEGSTVLLGSPTHLPSDG